MNQIIIAVHFKRQLKPHIKKYQNFGSDIIEWLETVEPAKHQKIRKNIYKMRFSPPALSRGKRSGFRVILIYISLNKIIIPVCLYAKNKMENMPDEEMNCHLHIVLAETKIKY